ncbi:MAG TPA: hypothetical protein VFB16_02910 [Bauldia sp.]|nr:hypothetical protein [Bauldia sp.]
MTLRPVRRTTMLAALLALGLAGHAFGQSTGDDTGNDEQGDDTPNYPTTEFAEGAKSASVTVGDIIAGISMVKRPDIDPNADVPVLQVSVGGKKVLEVPGVASGFDQPAAEASIVEMDPANQHEEVLFSSYSGGAHCCSNLIVAEELGGKWTAINVGAFDGDGNYLDDLDNDGEAEIVTVDNRFLYQFDCYACSAAPLTIYQIRSGKAVDATADPKYLQAHKDWLSRMEADVDPDDQWTSAGYLAGWVATKARVGQGADAMKQLRAHWDYDTDVGEEVCADGRDPDSCGNKNLVILKFPDRLERFLKTAGFPL